ncbi:MAG: head-tail adaptor protein [Pseudomonadales bacterium]|nr:head-tail adaptor protein [Pseudomonadales bacterium]
MAGDLRHLAAFEQRDPGKDENGAPLLTYTEQFQRYAGFVHLSGSEAVEAARLAGRELYKVKLRASPKTLGLSTDGWRLRRVDSDVRYNIVSVDIATDRMHVWLRVEGATPAVTP